MTHDDLTELRFPCTAAPGLGEVVEIADGLLWSRLPLPFQLDHVNIYLLRDEDGWTVVDTGINTEAARACWEQLLEGPLRAQRIAKVVATHFHPDHIGLAGWLCERFKAPLFMSMSNYLMAHSLARAPDEAELLRRVRFYCRHGMDERDARTVAGVGGSYLRLVTKLPLEYHRLLAQDRFQVGARSFRVLSADGHAPEQVMLFCETEKLLFAADQVIERISPNVGVSPNEPSSDPLGHFLRSLRAIKRQLPDDVLVLPGHERPFYGLHRRCAELEGHHEERCRFILAANCNRGRTAAQFMSVLFHRTLDPHQMGFAFAETLAHINRLIRRGELKPKIINDVIVNQSRSQ